MPRYGYDRLSAQDNNVPVLGARQRAHARRVHADLRGGSAAPRATAASTSSCSSAPPSRAAPACRATGSGCTRSRSSTTRCGSTIRTSTSTIHIRHTALPRPGSSDAAEDALRAHHGAAARPQAAALGDLGRRGPRGRPLRDDHEDPPLHDRRRVGRRSRAHPDVDVARGARARAAARRSIPRPAPSRLRAVARRGRARRSASRSRSCATSGSSPPTRRTSATSCRTRAKALVNTLGMGTSADETPMNGRVGPHRRFDWLSCRARRSEGGAQGARAARSTTSCSRS